jgi:1-phosphofructokinase
MILTVTPNPAVDQTIEMDEQLRANAVQRSTDAEFNSGGNGINVSQFLRALGSETVATGIVGGFTGYFIEQDLQRYDVPTDFVSVDGETRINTTLLTPEGEYHVNQSGPPVDAAVIDDLVGTVREYDPAMINVGGSLPPGMDAGDVDRIAGAGDWETAVEVPGEILPQLERDYEYCKPNREELAAATGVAIESIDDCAEAARALQDEGFAHVIASMGEDGAVMVTSESTLYAPALEAEVVDTIGAGDSMLAAVLWAYEQGWDDERALRAGVAASAHLVSVTGPSVHDLDPDATMDEVTVWSLDG